MTFGSRASSAVGAVRLLAGLALVLAVALAPRAGAASGSISLVVDTDLGNDDIVALAFLTGRSEVDLRAVTVSGTGLATCPGGARRAAKILRALGHPDVPVACGRDLPLAGFNSFPVEWRAAADRLGASLPASPTAVSRLSAPDLLADAVVRSLGRDTLLTLGPLTNVAEALRRHPSLRGEIALIVTMGGAVDVPGNVGRGHERAEFNIWVDPRAAKEVLASGIPITFVPLDATNDVPVDALLAREIDLRRGAAARLASEALDGLGPGTYYWDPLAAATLVDPGVVTMRRLRLSVLETGDSRNGSFRRGTNGVTANVAVSAHPSRFQLLLLRGIARDAGARIRLPKPAFTIGAAPGTCTAHAETTKPGAGWVRFRNRTKGQTVGVLVRLLDGRTIDDLREIIRTRGPDGGPPSWVELATFTSAAPGRDAWGEAKTRAGRYAVACFTEAGVGRVAPSTFELG